MYVCVCVCDFAKSVYGNEAYQETRQWMHRVSKEKERKKKKKKWWSRDGGEYGDFTFARTTIRRMTKTKISRMVKRRGCDMMPGQLAPRRCMHACVWMSVS